MAALLYLGSGIGTWLMTLFQTGDAEAKLGRADVPWLLGALSAGGVAAPIVLMFSLQITLAATEAASADDSHSHPHQHEAQQHQHAHTPDIHHRHEHE